VGNVGEWDANGLSAAARGCWGKTDRDTEAWMPLYRHMSDSAEIAGLLWDRWLPRTVKATMSGALPQAQGRILIRWLAGTHDIGKAAPGFAEQVEWMQPVLRRAGLPVSGVIRPHRAHHTLLSQAILQTWLRSSGMSRAAALAVSLVSAGHHGSFPDRRTSIDGEVVDGLGVGVWTRVQQELADWVADNTGVREVLAILDTAPPSAPAQVLLTAVVIVADWIASNKDWFPFESADSASERAERAWERVGLLAPWDAHAPDDARVQFRRRFSLGNDAELRPVQHGLVDLARTTNGPALYVVEAPMGVGKTEAALLAAEVLAEKFGLGGCFVALPTMATSDAMFGRVRRWIEQLDIDQASVFLAHGKAALNLEYRQMLAAPSLRVDAEEHDGCGGDVAVALEWLSGRKKGVLSSFVVGTVDQILMAGLKSRHLMLRHLALAGKVVVIDEVHSSDEFMAVYLTRVLHWLGAYGVPTVLLSATLSAGRRAEFLNAYRSGVPGAEGSGVVRDVRDYPLITVADATGVRTSAVPSVDAPVPVRVDFGSDDDRALIELVRAAGAEGGVIGVVRNTVRRAQATAALLRGEFGRDTVTLTHSRFVAVDRMAKESTLRGELGPPRSGRRRDGLRIVVGTQVLEQSLDIDVDLLITDLAPVDLILQRIGRLHRHRDRPGDQRGSMTQPRCVVVGADWDVVPPTPDRGSTHVYGRSALVRSAWVLQQHLARTGGVISVPDDIPALVNEAEDPALEVDVGWAEVLRVADDERALRRQARESDAETFVLGPVAATTLAWTHGSAGDAEGPAGRARVRDGEDTLEVLVGQIRDGRRSLLDGLPEHSGREVTLDETPPWGVARALAECSLRLPATVGVWRADRAIAELERAGSVAWQQSPWLRGELVLWLDEHMEAELAGVQLAYSRENGLVTRAAE
jgi:CRISPR-associated endonuclease/helicase Cas3